MSRMKTNFRCSYFQKEHASTTIIVLCSRKALLNSTPLCIQLLLNTSNRSPPSIFNLLFQFNAYTHSFSKTFSDPFYNSREESFPYHLFRLLTSWAVVADVWFLEPTTKAENETIEEFSNRVKALIAKQAGLNNVPWDGYMKYFRPSEKFIDERRRLFAQSIQRKVSSYNLQELEEEALSKPQEQTHENGTLSLKEHYSFQDETQLVHRKDSLKTQG